METTKEFKVTIPEGYEIDMENSLLAKGRIMFKEVKKKVPFSHYDGSYPLNGYFISDNEIIKFNSYTVDGQNTNDGVNKDVFTTEKLAKKALAMAQLSQIIEHDDTLKNYCFNIVDSNTEQDIYVIEYNIIDKVFGIQKYFIKPKILRYIGAEMNFLTFWLPSSSYSQQSIKEAILSFIEENEQLLKDYFMVND